MPRHKAGTEELEDGIPPESHTLRGERMKSTKQTARIAGVLYLANAVTGFFGIIYVPSRLIVSGNAAAT